MNSKSFAQQYRGYVYKDANYSSGGFIAGYTDGGAIIVGYANKAGLFQYPEEVTSDEHFIESVQSYEIAGVGISTDQLEKKEDMFEKASFLERSSPEVKMEDGTSRPSKVYEEKVNSPKEKRKVNLNKDVKGIVTEIAGKDKANAVLAAKLQVGKVGLDQIRKVGINSKNSKVKELFSNAKSGAVIDFVVAHGLAALTAVVETDNDKLEIVTDAMLTQSTIGLADQVDVPGMVNQFLSKIDVSKLTGLVKK
jgi:hypothetical protein